jgi:hypothetical protein
MRIDSDPRNLVTGGDRFPVDLDLPQVPADQSDIDFSLLVHEDVVDFDNAALAGMPPLFGKDEIEALPPLAYEPGLDGETARVVGLAPAGGLDFDALDALPHLRNVGGLQPSTAAAALPDNDSVIPGNAFAPFLDPFTFVRADTLEPPLRPEERRALAQIGHDAVQFPDATDWDTRVPLVGQDDIVFATQLPDTTTYRNARDGIERPRPARMLRI